MLSVHEMATLTSEAHLRDLEKRVRELYGVSHDHHIVNRLWYPRGCDAQKAVIAYAVAAAAELVLRYYKYKTGTCPGECPRHIRWNQYLIKLADFALLAIHAQVSHEVSVQAAYLT